MMSAPDNTPILQSSITNKRYEFEIDPVVYARDAVRRQNIGKHGCIITMPRTPGFKAAPSGGPVNSPDAIARSNDAKEQKENN